MVVGVFNVCGVFGGWRLGVGPEPLARRVVVLWENKQTTIFVPLCRVLKRKESKRRLCLRLGGWSARQRPDPRAGPRLCTILSRGESRLQCGRGAPCAGSCPVTGASTWAGPFAAKQYPIRSSLINQLQAGRFKLDASSWTLPASS